MIEEMDVALATTDLEILIFKLFSESPYVSVITDWSCVIYRLSTG